MTCAHLGKLVLRTVVVFGRQGKRYERTITLQNVLYVPDLRANLLSCSRLCESGYRIDIRRSKCNGFYDGVVMFSGRMINVVYRVDAIPVSPAASAFSVTSRTGSSGRSSYEKEGLRLWHLCLGHAHTDSIKELLTLDAVNRLDLDARIQRKECDSCIRGKQTKQRLRTSTSRSKEPGAVIHSGICGPMSVKSFSDARYFVSFIDECSGYIVKKPISLRIDALQQFKFFHA